MIPEILGDLDHAKEQNSTFDIQIVPAMSNNYYGFQHQGDLFNKKELRQAFNYAIDREKIVTYTKKPVSNACIKFYIAACFIHCSKHIQRSIVL